MKNFRSKQKAFTLLEILVAFTLLSITFATVLQIIAGSTRNTIKASRNTKIALLAQTKFDELGLYEKIEEGSNNGDFDDTTHWMLDIEPYDVPYDGDVNQEFASVELMNITLTVTSQIGNKQQVNEFHTLRAVTPDFSKER